jgi:hypothetical protein
MNAHRPSVGRLPSTGARGNLPAVWQVVPLSEVVEINPRPALDDLNEVLAA